jgi:hypothetical protein
MFAISKKGSKWVLKCEQGFIRIPELGPNKQKYYELYGDAVDTTVGWTQIVDSLIKELEGRTGCSRMSYDTWYWDDKVQLDQFLTYFYLKYPRENWYPMFYNDIGSDPLEDIQ